MADSDSEEELYLLQPSANEYNIAEKIKEANQELYSQPQASANTASRRVRFREQLEDFEPEETSEVEEHSRASSQNNRIQEIDNISEVSSDDGYGESNNSDIQMEEVQIEDIEEVLSTKSDQESEDVSEICEQLDEELSLKTESLARSPEVIDRSDKKVEQTKTKKVTRKKIEPPVVVVVEEPEHEQPSGVQRCFPKKYRPKSSRVKPTSNEHPRKMKDCCQYKTTEVYLSKLPKYRGVHSEYGLSQEELEQKHLKEQKVFHLKQVKQLKTKEEKEVIEKNNEDAFRKWLFEKMRHPINKSKNMFDVKYSKYILKYRRKKEPTRKESRTESSPEMEYNENNYYDDDEDQYEEQNENQENFENDINNEEEENERDESPRKENQVLERQQGQEFDEGENEDDEEENEGDSEENEDEGMGEENKN